MIHDQDTDYITDYVTGRYIQKHGEEDDKILSNHTSLRTETMPAPKSGKFMGYDLPQKDQALVLFNIEFPKRILRVCYSFTQSGFLNPVYFIDIIDHA